MSHILEVCTAFDDYSYNVTYLAQSQAPAFETVRWVWLNFIFFVPAVSHSSTFPECKWTEVGMKLSSPTSACAQHLQAPEFLVILPADEQKAMPCVMSKENVLNCNAVLHNWFWTEWFPFSQSVSLKYILPLRFWGGLSYFKCKVCKEINLFWMFGVIFKLKKYDWNEKLVP